MQKSDKIRAVIVDDELKAREGLEEMLRKYCPEVGILATESNISDAVKTINEQSPNLLFLDIKLHNGTGFDILDQVRERNFEVVFTTAYSQYAVQAIKFSALDYLLKPINVEELQESVKRATTHIHRNLVLQDEKLDVLVENLSRPDSQEEQQMVLSLADGFKVSNLSEIVRCTSERNYTWVYLQNGNNMLTTKTLKEYEDLLQDKGFFRCHNSHLINMRYVSKFKRGKNPTVELNDGSMIRVSRLKREAFIQALNHHSQSF